MVVGSIATADYGEPRLTRDLDGVIRVNAQAAKDFLAHFPSSEFYVPPDAIVIQEFSRHAQFNLLPMPSGLKGNVVVQRGAQHGISEFDRRCQVEFLPG